MSPGVDIVMVVVIVVCTLFLGVVVGWASRGVAGCWCGRCGFRMMCLRCVPETAVTAARQAWMRIPR